MLKKSIISGCANQAGAASVLYARLALLLFCLATVLSLAGPVFAANARQSGQQQAGRQHLVFFRGTAQELDVYKISGLQAGPTVMLLGGIHGDEPGAYLSADSYADLIPRRGNLIVVPRSNGLAVSHGQRGPAGDMNRKFGQVKKGDPENRVVEVLKSLMAESDLVLTLHDGSGFYRPEWESDQANPKRYGQCVIADSARFTNQKTGQVLELEQQARAAIKRINAEIANPLHYFHFFNMETGGEASLYKEHRNSATYYALTRLGVPAFCIETSKSLPSLDVKVRQHNLVINAFLELYGLELETPAPRRPAPEFSHLVISVGGPNAAGGELPLALARGQTLHLPKGALFTVRHAGTNFERGLVVSRAGGNLKNCLGQTLRADGPFSLDVRRDSRSLGQVHIALLAAGESLPKVSGASAAFAPAGLAAKPESLPGHRLVAELENREALELAQNQAQSRAAEQAAREARERAAAEQAAREAQAAQAAQAGQSTQAGQATPAGRYGQVAAFLLEVDGKAVSLDPGQELPVLHGSILKLVNMKSADSRPLPPDLAMNLKGFISKSNEARNSGDDRGGTARIPQDMLRGHSEGGRGEVYAINAELGKKVLASCRLRLIKPELESITVRIDGQIRVLGLGSRTPVRVGATVELLEVRLRGGHALSRAHYTLAGKPVSTALPQRLTMREIAINLAVFNGENLAGKVTWLPVK